MTIAVVSGGSNGIGKATALELGRGGVGVILTYHSNKEGAEALSSWTRYIAKELAPRQIRVNAVSPGPTHTNLSDGAFDKNPEFGKTIGAEVALGRIGYPEDLAKVIVNLLSEDFGWVTAQDIEVSGGHLL